MSVKSKAVHQIVQEISEIYTKKYDLKYSGTSLAAPRGVYNEIGVSFDSKGLLTKEQTRVILLDVADALLEKINNNSDLKPHLKNYPFNWSNITINIFINSVDHKRVYHPDLRVASLYSDKLWYKYESSETERKGNYFLQESETIEEARGTVNQQFENE